MGGSFGKSESNNQSNNQWGEDIWGPQGEALQGLWDQASELYGGSGGFQDKLNEIAGGLGGYNQGIMEGQQGGYDSMLGGGSFGDTSDIRNQLMDSLRQSSGGSNLGSMYESIVGGSGNTYVDPMVDAMKQGAMENNAMLQSGTAMDAASAGQGGSSRHAMQNAMTNRMTNQDMMDKETAMRGGAYDKDLAMKMDIARQADSGVQNSQNMLMDMLTGADSNVQAGMGMGQGMQNIGMGSMAPWMQAQNQAWSPMNNWASILGNPTILGQGSGSSSGSSKGKNTAGGLWG